MWLYDHNKVHGSEVLDVLPADLTGWLYSNLSCMLAYQPTGCIQTRLYANPDCIWISFGLHVNCIDCIWSQVICKHKLYAHCSYRLFLASVFFLLFSFPCMVVIINIINNLRLLFFRIHHVAALTVIRYNIPNTDLYCLQCTQYVQKYI